ncbi:DUF3152 domain-containing protein [Bifidobacterium sp. ESL0775]|uniref:DUF3152 domain-containing protein n=1 Tax=Bifidobacterium sp. ESL0775 TaxID=2983230 RepID=UPI0023F9CD25|nr:DUF3152 domain-containing protein [Bifidobacterium sp. ESL0775]WEV69202.1 DUF3152 domain-containing protein [Bifidobacterium sp. ESL0775]
MAVAVFLGFRDAEKPGRNGKSPVRRPHESQPSRHGSADTKPAKGTAVSDIPGGFIGSVLASDADDPQAANPSRRHRKSAAPKIPQTVYWVRRIVVLVVALAVIAAVAFGVKTAISHTVASHQASSSQSVKKSKAKRHTKKSDKRKALTADLTKPTPQPVLTDQSRAALLAQAQATASASGKLARHYSYCVSTKGNVGGSDVQQEFENIIFRTLNDPRGWPRAGATFAYSADSSHCDFVIYLSQPSLMTTFSGNCSDEYSCRVGNNVIINEDRWNGATPQMLGVGMSIDRYRIMVINHEVGHRLGHIDNDPSCPAPNAPAPLMQEQSMSLRGCKPNEWPTDPELWIK